MMDKPLVCNFKRDFTWKLDNESMENLHISTYPIHLVSNVFYHFAGGMNSRFFFSKHFSTAYGIFGNLKLADYNGS